MKMFALAAFLGLGTASAVCSPCYEKPPACTGSETSVQITGVTGDFCSPLCYQNQCPKGDGSFTATPSCVLETQGSSKPTQVRSRGHCDDDAGLMRATAHISLGYHAHSRISLSLSFSLVPLSLYVRRRHHHSPPPTPSPPPLFQCALICTPGDNAACPAGASCQSIQGEGICTYPASAGSNQVLVPVKLIPSNVTTSYNGTATWTDCSKGGDTIDTVTVTPENIVKVRNVLSARA